MGDRAERHAATQYLFVYGSLRRAAGHPLGMAIGRHATYLREGWFNGKLYQIADYPGAVPSGNASDRVYGEIHALHHSALFAQLDDYEACSPCCPHPHEYRREPQSVHTAAGQHLVAWVYLYNRPLDESTRILGGDWLAWLSDQTKAKVR